MSLKKLAVATLLIGGGIAAATYYSPAFNHLFSVSEPGVSRVGDAENYITSNQVAMTAYVESDVATADRKPAQDKKKPVEIAGKWQVIRALREGTPLSFDRFGSMTVEFDADKIIIGSGAKEEVGKMSTDQVSMIGETSFAEVVISPTGDDMGDKKEIRGFYYHEEGELTFILGAPGAERPDPTDEEDFANARILTLKVAE